MRFLLFYCCYFEKLMDDRTSQRRKKFMHMDSWYSLRICWNEWRFEKTHSHNSKRHWDKEVYDEHQSLFQMFTSNTETHDTPKACICLFKGWHPYPLPFALRTILMTMVPSHKGWWEGISMVYHFLRPHVAQMILMIITLLLHIFLESQSMLQVR